MKTKKRVCDYQREGKCTANYCIWDNECNARDEKGYPNKAPIPHPPFPYVHQSKGRLL